MFALLCFVLAVLASPFKSKRRLEAENVALRQQLIVLRRKVPGRVRLTNNDRWFFIQLYRSFPSILQVLTIIRPETLVRWHRAGFRQCWHWKSRSPGWAAPSRDDPTRRERYHQKSTPEGGQTRRRSEIFFGLGTWHGPSLHCALRGEFNGLASGPI